jgi:hypothetical protein
MGFVQELSGRYAGAGLMSDHLEQHDIVWEHTVAAFAGVERLGDAALSEMFSTGASGEVSVIPSAFVHRMDRQQQTEESDCSETVTVT